MKIFNDFNTTDLKKIDRETYKFLKNSKPVKENLPFLYSKAGLQYDRIRDNKRLARTPIDFAAHFDIQIKNNKLRIHLGAKIDKNDSSYYLAICERINGMCNIQRKFHFDFDKSAHKCRPPHPNFHLQYGGKASPELMNPIHDDYDWILTPSLSEPRLFFHPVSLSLILNLVFTEFSSVAISKIKESPEWRKRVKADEDAIIKPYLDRCHEFINSEGRHTTRNLFLTDYCYGK